jgi:hypothetical protein
MARAEGGGVMKQFLLDFIALVASGLSLIAFFYYGV